MNMNYQKYTIRSSVLLNQKKPVKVSFLPFDDIPFKFGIDSNGNYGYIKVGADTVTPFKDTDNITILNSSCLISGGTFNFNIPNNFNGHLLLTAYTHYPCMSSTSSIKFSDNNVKLLKILVDSFMFENTSSWGGYVRYGKAIYKIITQNKCTLSINVSSITNNITATILS